MQLILHLNGPNGPGPAILFKGPDRQNWPVSTSKTEGEPELKFSVKINGHKHEIIKSFLVESETRNVNQNLTALNQ